MDATNKAQLVADEAKEEEPIIIELANMVVFDVSPLYSSVRWGTYCTLRLPLNAYRQAAPDSDNCSRVALRYAAGKRIIKGKAKATDLLPWYAACSGPVISATHAATCMFSLF